MKIYVAGAVEHALKNRIIAWWYRKRIQRKKDLLKELEKRGYELLFSANVPIAEEKGTPEYAQKAMNVVIKDLSMVNFCDIVLAIYCAGVRKGAGTHGEITVARHLIKPTVVWLNEYHMGSVPGWVFGCGIVMDGDVEDVCRLIEVIAMGLRDMDDGLVETTS